MITVVGIISYNQMKPTLRNFKNLDERIQQKTKFYSRESEHLNNRITDLQQDFTSLQRELDLKSIHFQDFADKQGNFQQSIRYLQDHAGEYSQGITKNLKNEIKEEGPKILESFKRAFKKTINKQKIRYKSKRES